MSHQFETKIYALGVYWHCEVTYDATSYNFRENDIEITDLWLLGCYPEGCESTAAVDRNDYEPVRIKADVGYLEPTEYRDLVSRCQKHFETYVQNWLEVDDEI